MTSFLSFFIGITSVIFLSILVFGPWKMSGALKMLVRFVEILFLIIFPLMHLWMLDSMGNDCCDETATFSPHHLLTIYTIITICVVSYFYSSGIETIASPLIEVITTIFLMIGIILNVFLLIQVFAFFIFIIPIIMLFLVRLVHNLQRQIREMHIIPKNKAEEWALKILKLNVLLKIPVLIILIIPVLSLLTCFLLLFGQKPDSIIRAFTDTYTHHFSKLDYECYNVQCGGHYLCSVAANGHTKIVKPYRLGVRNGKLIVCNRQLLISNAFEDLVQEKMPLLHQFIRSKYNKVGDFIHRYYSFFNIKIVSDMVYVMMKPFEWFFLITLYAVDVNPENRIAKQYLTKDDRVTIDKDYGS